MLGIGKTVKLSLPTNSANRNYNDESLKLYLQLPNMSKYFTIFTCVLANNQR